MVPNIRGFANCETLKKFFASGRLYFVLTTMIRTTEYGILLSLFIHFPVPVEHIVFPMSEIWEAHLGKTMRLQYLSRPDRNIKHFLQSMWADNKVSWNMAKNSTELDSWSDCRERSRPAWSWSTSAGWQISQYHCWCVIMHQFSDVQYTCQTVQILHHVEK